MRFLKAFGFFWYDFIIGDDWKIAAYVLGVLVAVAVAARHEVGADGLLVVVGTVGLIACFVAGVVLDARRSRR